MNKIYKLVWSKARNMYVAVAEIARSHTKGPKSGVISHTVAAGVLAAVIACGAVMPAYAEAPGIGINNLNTEAVNYDGSGAMGYDSIAIGDAKAAGGGSVAVGADALTTGVNAIAIGAGSTATGDGTTREQINAILSNNKAIRDGVDAARGDYTISEQDYLRQKEIFDGQNEAVARVNHANDLINGYQNEIDTTLKPKADAANDAYNQAKSEYDALYNDYQNRISQVKYIDFSLYENTQGEFDLASAAAKLKTDTESGTTFDLPQSFYEDYITNYIKAEGDLRVNKLKVESVNNVSKGVGYGTGSVSFKLDGSVPYTANAYDVLNSVGVIKNEETSTSAKNLYRSITFNSTLSGNSLNTSEVFTFGFAKNASNPSGSGITNDFFNFIVKSSSGNSFLQTLQGFAKTGVMSDSAYETKVTELANARNYLITKMNDEVSGVSTSELFKSNSQYLNDANALIANNTATIDSTFDIIKSVYDIAHEQYLYEKYRDEGNQTEALRHLGLKENARDIFITKGFGGDSTKYTAWLNNAYYPNPLSSYELKRSINLDGTLSEGILRWVKENIVDCEDATKVALRILKSNLDTQIAEKRQALRDATNAKNAADTALKNKQNQINKAQPSQQDLDDAAAAEASAQELQQKKDKLDADKAALEAAKANLVNLETIASDGENAIAIGGNAISTGNAAIGIGADVIVTGENAVGIGKNTIASGKNSVAVGPSNSVAKENGVAVGNNNGVTGMNSIAIGTGNVVSGTGSVAIGNGLNVTEDNVVVLGGKKMTAMADGTVGLNSTDAVTGKQLYQETRFVNVNTEKTEGDGATGTDSVAVGIDSKVTGDLSTSIGNTNTITGANSIAVGTGHVVAGNNSGAIGDPNIVNGDNSYAVGNNSTIAAGTADVFVLGNNVNATASNTVVLGSNSDGSQANTVSVGSAAQKRRIVNVANGTSATDVATMGQTIELVAGDNVTVTADGTNDAGQKKFRISSTGGSGGINYADQYHSQVILDGSAYSDSDGNPQVGTTLSGLKDGWVSASSTEAVTGAQLYQTNRSIANLDASLSQTNAAVAGMQTDVTTLKTNYTVLRSQYDTTKTQVETGFNVTANGAKVKTVNPDSNYIDFKAGDGITITNDNGAVKITNSIQADGQVASGDTKVVSGNTVYNEVRPAADGNYVKTAKTTGENLTALDTAVKANETAIDALDGSAVKYDGTDKTKVTLAGNGGTTIDNLKDGTLSASSKEAVNGSQLFTTNQNLTAETTAREAADTALSDRIGTLSADGNYILKDNNVSTNLSTLDNAIKGLSDGKANTGLDNITDGGKTVIRDLAKESVKVVAGEHTTVTEGTDGNAKTYAVNVKTDGQIADGDTNVVSGDTVYDYVKTQTDVIDDKLDLKANKDASNVADQTAKWGAAIGTGTVAEGNGELVTGGTVFTEVRPVSDGEYVKTANTTGSNLLALDGQVKTNADDIDGLKDLSNITNDGETVIKNLAKGVVNVVSGDHANVVKTDVDGVDTYTVNVLTDGAIEDGNTGVVNGDVVYDAIKTAKDEVTEATDTKLEGYAKIDGSNVTTPATWGQKLGTGVVAEGNGELVTGGTMFTELRPADGTYVKNANTTAANLSALDGQVKTNTDDITNLKDLSNITNEGQTVIKNLAKGAVNVASGDHANVVKTDVNGVDTYTVNVLTDGAIEDGNTGVVSGDTVYDYVKAQTDAIETDLNGKANVDASNVTNAEAWGQKIATGAVREGDVKAVSGDTVAKALKTEREARENADTTINNRIDALDGSVVKYDGADKSKVTLGGADGTTIDNLKPATLSANSKEAVNGSQLFETNEKIGTITDDGTYVKTTNNVSENLVALDSAVSELSDGKADTNLNNITNDGKTVVRDLAKEAVKVVNGEHTTVTEGEDGDAKTYAVNVAADGQVVDGNTGIVSGDTVFDAIKDAKDEVNAATDTKLEGYAKVDGSNVTTPATWGEKLGTGEVEADNGELVTGDTVYNALNNAVTNINTALDGKANADASNIGIHAATDNSIAWGDAIGTGAVVQSDHRLVTGGTVYNEVRPDSDGTIVKVNNTTGQNLLALDATIANLKAQGEDAVVYDASDHNKVTLTATSNAGTTLTNVRAGVISKASRDAINGGQLWSVKQDIEGFAEDIRRNANSIQTLNGSVSNALASVAAANTLVNTVNDLKADASLNNLSAAGKQVISSAAMDAVQQYMAQQNGSNGTNSNIDPNLSTNYYNVNVADLIDDLAGDSTGLDGFKKTNNASRLATSLRTMNPTDTSTNYVVYDDADATQITLEDATGEGTKITNLAEGSLSAASTDAVNGAQLYKTNRDIAAMQETLSTNNGTVAALQTDTQTLKTNMITLQSQYATTKTQVETGFNVTVDGAKVKTVNPDSAYMDFATGDHTEIVNDNGSVRINVKDDGKIVSGDTGLVTGDTVYEAIKDFSTSSAMEGKANVALDNLTSDGETVVRDLAKEALNVVSGDDYVTVNKTADGNADSYSVSVKVDGRVSEGNVGIVTGGTVYDALKDTAELIDTTTNSKLEAYAKKDASNVDAGVWGTKLGTGKVNASDGKLVSGKTVAGETRVANNGNYILKDNSAAQNLSVLDTVLKETRDIAEAAAASGTDANAVHYDGDDKSSITLEGANGTKIMNLSDGDVSATSTDAVTGRQLFETNENLAVLDSRVGTVTDGNYVSADKSMGENINALDGQLKTVSDGLGTVRTDVATLRTDVDDLNDKVAGFESELDDKVDTDLSNLTEGGKTVISGIAKESVKVKGAGLAKVTSAEEGNATVYTVNVQADGKVEENNTGVVNGGTVYNSINAVRNDFAKGLDGKADTDLSNITVNGKNVIREAVKDDLAKKADKVDLNKKANVDASNIQVEAWAAKLGVGEIAEGNTGLVNGGTVYDAIQKVDRNNNIAEIKDDVVYIGAREGGNVISVYNNEGQGRVITGVITNPEDASSAANVGYVNAVGENIVGQMQNQFNRVDNKMNKVGANAAAMASLMPAPMDGDEKWSLSAAVGNYRNATAAAVGVFYKPQDNIMMNLRGSFGNEENMVGGGVSVALNRGNTPGVTKAQLAKAVNAQAAKIADQDAEIAELKAIVQQVAADKRQGK